MWHPLSNSHFFGMITFSVWYTYPTGSMYDIFTYIWLKCLVNVGTVNIPYKDPMGIDLHLPHWERGPHPTDISTLGEPLPNGNFRATWVFEEKTGVFNGSRKQGSCHAVCHAGSIGFAYIFVPCLLNELNGKCRYQYKT